MDAIKLEELIIKNTKGLPQEALREILDFIQFIREKKLKLKGNNLLNQLSELDRNEAVHLEEEFSNYKNLYPHDEGDKG